MIHKLNLSKHKHGSRLTQSPFANYDAMVAAGTGKGSEGAAIVEVASVVKTYHHSRTGEVVVFDNYSMRVENGEMLAVVGSSGAGKSTLMHMIGALETPTAGTISYKGRKLNSLSKNELTYLRSREVGFVFQSHFLLNELSAFENVMLPLLIRGKSVDEAKEDAFDLLSSMGLDHREEHYPLELSGGEQQRVAIARAIANKPSLILADEPTGNLDSENAEMIMNIFHNLNRQGVTIVVVTHSNDVSAQCSRVETLQTNAQTRR